MNSILQDLKNIITGEISNQSSDLAEVSQDFGNIIQKKPQIVIRPQNSRDIAAAIKYAAKQGLTISSRAAGRSLSGQSLNEGGVLLDMRNLHQIHKLQPKELWFEADAGVTWKQVIDTAIPHGVIPPVLTNNFDVTVGGTLSTAGLGLSSFRYGSQAENCLGLEVVTGTGDIVWCTPAENSELFHHVLCGYGQFGIITKVKNRLRQYRPYTRSYFLCYDNLNQLLDDARSLVTETPIDGLVSLFSPCLQGMSRAKNPMKPLIHWFYRMQITVEVDDVNQINDAEFLGDLNFYRHIHTEDLTFAQFIQPLGQVPYPVNTANTWIDVLLPASQAKEFIDIALERIPSFLDFRTLPIGSFCLNSRHHKLPMFPLPDHDLIIGLGMYPTIPKTQVEPVLQQLNLLTDLSLQMGGKRYMATWAQFDLPRWRWQFGDYWPKVNHIKRKYDPLGILNPGFFQYEQLVETGAN
ncbi:FAD-binding protein [Umezakia ovalisporum]|uniref:FAD-binding protein n=1 Tax=Umezakia ovalisporum FSS-43 TaxID=2740520 RepID=A0ABT6JZ33_9CYAN|nr:FAD-binding protein [Umezakia ovalisporum]MDH6055266.1 FAD-binding protein [Umezakia ovalisporum FSS-43]MDH6071779.1 FAD-binding protein [Umezakia ovalisporum CobakiLakeA]MDH6077051.1 FAD-binding protein [Umezakia ovalisporum FSS-45]MDH6082143.1 FAD-binding protein [Umezakia ovalisporum FSS-44]MDH6097238.1 FAD-binding protein [Umezakia ovalisporum CobakiLakeB]